MEHFQPQQILCPLDLSPASAAVLSWARLIAEAFSAKVNVLHAEYSEFPRYFTEGQVQDLAAEERASKHQLQNDVECLARRVLGDRVPYAVTIESGNAVEVILAKLRAGNADIVVMGSHGHSGIARLMMGSVAENVVREARVPVLIVRGPELAPGTRVLRQVLCSSDLRDGGNCITVAAEIASRLEAEAQIVHAVETPGPSASDEKERLCRLVPDRLKQRCKTVDVLLHGDPAEEVISFARANATDLIVVGVRHRHFLEFSAIGRTTERLMRHSPSSVLLVPESA